MPRGPAGAEPSRGAATDGRRLLIVNASRTITDGFGTERDAAERNIPPLSVVYKQTPVEIPLL